MTLKEDAQAERLAKNEENQKAQDEFGKARDAVLNPKPEAEKKGKK